MGHSHLEDLHGHIDTIQLGSIDTSIWIYTFLAVIIVSLISLIGVFTLAIKRKNLDNILLYLVSFSAGALLGGAFLHLIPETAHQSEFTLQTSIYILSGIILFFVIEKFIHFRHCHTIPKGNNNPHPFAWMNLIGDAVHNFIDGLIIAASFIISKELGIATTIAVIFHEIPQEIGDFGVLLHGGFTRKKALILNFLTALSAVLGAIIVLLAGSKADSITPIITPFAAGGFIYIACSDLIPELHKENKFNKLVMQFIVFMLGIGLMALLMHDH